jgi:hypothetical protein
MIDEVELQGEARPVRDAREGLLLVNAVAASAIVGAVLPPPSPALYPCLDGGGRGALPLLLLPSLALSLLLIVRVALPRSLAHAQMVKKLQTRRPPHVVPRVVQPRAWLVRQGREGRGGGEGHRAASSRVLVVVVALGVIGPRHAGQLKYMSFSPGLCLLLKHLLEPSSGEEKRS